jgi:hypothetical protein
VGPLRHRLAYLCGESRMEYTKRRLNDSTARG